MFVVRFPPVLFLAWYLFPHLGLPAWGLIAVWIGIFADLSFRAVVNGVIFKRGAWQRKMV
jgi:Na+-driven multidrug efflux pump